MKLALLLRPLVANPLAASKLVHVGALDRDVLKVQHHPDDHGLHPDAIETQRRGSLHFGLQ